MPNNGLSSLLWFIAIVAAIPAVLWLMKRTQLQRGGLPGPVKHIAVLPLSPSQRLVTVEVGRGDSRCWLVLGVTPNGISTLHTMLPQDDLAVPTLGTLGHQAADPSVKGPAGITFAQLLQRLQGRGPDAR